MRAGGPIGSAATALLAVCLTLLVPAAASAQAPTPMTCGWPVKSDPDSLNVAFPDESATYWVRTFTPGARLVIRGHFPAARYFSFHAYDAASRPVASLADFEIRPEAGDANPFATPRAKPGGRYAIRVDPAAPPAEPEPNTLYAGATEEGAPNPAGVLIYRVYASSDRRDPAGGPLPEVLVESPGGEPVQTGDCDPLPPSTGGAIADAIAGLSYPEGAPGIPYPLAADPPAWTVFRGIVGTGGFFSNQHVGSYGALHISHEHGEVVVFRAKAPTFPDTRAGDSAADRRAQLRYWSICMNELATQRFVDCSPDDRTRLSRRGRFTFVISDPDDRPENATRAHDVNWLPWGGTSDGLVLYRHMLPRAGFERTWTAVPPEGDPAETLGRYYPRAAYCTTERFEGEGPAGCLD